MKVNNITKGIILAGGSGTRLHPLTKVVSKQLLPIYDQPMIYFPLSILIKAGIKDIMIISTPQDQSLFQRLLDDGSQWGVSIEYSIQSEPKGIAQAFIISQDWLNNSNCILILGDNLFFGPSLDQIIKNAVENNNGGTIFGYKVRDPNRFGVIEFNTKNEVISIEEKPELPKSDWIATGLYIYDNKVAERTKTLDFSKRGELEITDLNNIYLENKELNVVLLNEDFSWLDTGTHKTLLEASNFVKKIKDEFGSKSIGLI
ncbi:MAG: glucose-1-phosphate thymidylyltransferase [Gammaproteobacteria bacterium]|nr:glucose-1-phosphate thymidylyltransferase [Gammaproteobacteria bacterium]